MNQPLHVVMLMHDYLPMGGGAETQLAALAPALKDCGVNISVIARRYPDLKAYEEIDGVPVYRMFNPGSRILTSLAYTATSIPKINSLKPDLLHAHTFISPATTAIVAKRLFHKPFVLTAHRSGELGEVQRLQRRKSGKPRLEALKQNVDAFICISREIDEELDGIGVMPEKRHFLPNGVDVDQFQPLSLEEKQQLREKLDIPKDALVAIFTGRLDPEKRVNNLLTVWDEIRAEHPQALLLILGTGLLEDELHEMAGEGVRFTGRVNNVADYLQASDAFVLPSIAEGLSVSMLEAMASGLPAIITNVGGATDAINHMKNGWLIEPDNLADLKEALLKILGDTPLRTQLGEQARERVLHNFHLPVIASRLRQVYDELLGTNQ